MTDPWRQEVNHQAVRDAVLFWWEHRHEPLAPLQPATFVGYVPRWTRSEALLDLGARTGYVMQVLPDNQRLVQFGGEEDGAPAIRIVATLDELMEL